MYVIPYIDYRQLINVVQYFNFNKNVNTDVKPRVHNFAVFGKACPLLLIKKRV